MKNLLFTLVLLLFTVTSSSAQDSKKVLFIGNSYTAVNNLPSLVNEMAISTGDNLVYDSTTPGGYRFLNHAADANTSSKISSDAWDYVVLQGQSQETSFGQSQMANEVFPHAESLCNAIRNNNECSMPLFYMTWGRENGDASNCAYLPWVCTYEGMDDVIRDTYIYMSDENDTELSPVGAVWRSLRNNHPDIDLYSTDGSHPSLAGSYAAACAFYTMIYKKDPTLINWDSTLDAMEAITIRQTAKDIVYDFSQDWDFSVNTTAADFTESITGSDVSFMNFSSDFDSLLWDFDDGNTSTEIDPIHTYTQSGDYTVSLTAFKCNKSDLISKTINIEIISDVESFEPDHSFSAYPSLVADNLIIRLNADFLAEQIDIFDINGNLISRTQIKNTSLNIDASAWQSGNYFLKATSGSRAITKKIVKK